MDYFNVVLEDELRAKLDEYVRQKLQREKPMSKAEWFNTPEGKRHFNVLNCRPEWRNKSAEQVNKYLHDGYVEATGGVKTGRPRMAQVRTKVITEALIAYFKALNI